MEHQFHITDIELNRSTINENIIGMFRYESETKHQHGSTLLILAEIDSALYAYERLLDVLNETAERTRRLISQFEGDPIARFEKCVQRLNEAVAQFVQDEPTPIAWDRVNVFILELSENHICLSGIGRLYNVFYQKQEDGSFRKFDLLGSLEAPAHFDPQKPFASLVCGDIHPGDMLFIGTTNFERVREDIHLTSKITRLPAVTAGIEIRQALEQQNIPDDFAGVIISVVQALKAPAQEKKETDEADDAGSSTASVHKLYEEEEKTRVLLSPALTPFAKSAEAGEPSATLADLFKRACARSRETLKNLLTRKQKRTPDPVALAGLRSLNAGHGSFITKKKKMGIAIAVAALVVAIGGTLIYRGVHRARAEQNLWDITYNQALDKKTRAEADLVYNNEDQARILVKEALAILTSLDEKNAKQRTAKAVLLNGLNELRQKLKREQRVDAPTEIAVAEGGWKDFIATKTALFGLVADGTSLIKIDPKTHQQTPLPLTTASSSYAGAALVTNKDTVFVLTKDKHLLALNAKQDGFVLFTFPSEKIQTLSASTFYARRLYTVDPDRRMIWKFASIEGGFGAPVAYLKQNTENLADAVSLAIDSSVYIGFKNGKIARYLSGVEEVWAPHEIDPALTSLSSLWTQPETDRLVLTDSTNKRVIVIRKDGALIAQILSPVFQNPTVTIGDAANKLLYILDGKRIVSVPLP